MEFKDQTENFIQLAQLPQRIVSLVPSQTELLFDLGLAESVIGVTKFCAHPSDAKKKAIVGGTKKIRLDVIRKLQPDLILGNKEENTRRDIENLRWNYPVWLSNIFKLSDALQMIRAVGKLTGTEKTSELLVADIELGFSPLEAFREKKMAKVLYLIWNNPFMAVGQHTFIDDMLQWCGLENAVTSYRYPVITPDEISRLSPDFIFLSSEPYPL